MLTEKNRFHTKYDYISVYYVQGHECEKNFHTCKKLQAEITEKFKNFKVEIEKILRSK